jgi:acetyltransferase-like isoleucine patch superfamily enzyme
MTQIFHPTVTISRFADLEDSKRGSVLRIDEDVVIESFVKIKFAGGSGDVSIGQRSYINAGVVIYSGNGVSIGKGVLIAANCTLAATNHQISDPDRFIRDQGFAGSKGGIIIEDDVWIGANCVILDGSIIRKGAVIGAGSGAAPRGGTSRSATGAGCYPPRGACRAPHQRRRARARRPRRPARSPWGMP